MRKLVFSLFTLAAFAGVSEAGPVLDAVREWRQARQSRGCSTCSPAAVGSYTAPTPAVVTMPQVGTVAYQPGPVRQAVGTVLVSTGGLIQQAGQAVGSGDGYPPIRLGFTLPVQPVCSGGACGVAR